MPGCNMTRRDGTLSISRDTEVRIERFGKDSQAPFQLPSLRPPSIGKAVMRKFVVYLLSITGGAKDLFFPLPQNCETTYGENHRNKIAE